MTNVTLYGPKWSAYTRTARLVLAEKEIRYCLREVDFSSGIMPAEHFKLNPFGKVPVLAHEDYIIYETSAICRYIDEAFGGSHLQPSNVQERGRMSQVIAILDSCLSEEIRMGFVNELLIKPKIGMVPDRDRVEHAQASIKMAMGELARLAGSNKFLAGQNITLADLHAAPLFDYLEKTPGGEKLTGSQVNLQNWWSLMKTRSSVVETEPDLTVFDTI